MILVDANLLLCAANGAAPEHDRARSWLDDRLNGSARVGLPWPSLLAFVRLATNPVVVRAPASMADAWRQVEEWLACEPAWTPLPGAEHSAILRATAGVAGDDEPSRPRCASGGARRRTRADPLFHGR